MLHDRSFLFTYFLFPFYIGKEQKNEERFVFIHETTIRISKLFAEKKL